VSAFDSRRTENEHASRSPARSGETRCLGDTDPWISRSGAGFGSGQRIDDENTIVAIESPWNVSFERLRARRPIRGGQFEDVREMIPSIWVRRLILSVLVFSLGPSSLAELGDINGDGRVSFSDAHLFFEHEDIESPPGTVDWEEHVPCTFFAERAYKLLFLEALRRVTPGAPPQFFETWPTPGKAEAPAPEPSDRVQLSVLPLEYEGGASSLTLEVELTTSVELEFVTLILRSPGLRLRPPSPRSDGAGAGSLLTKPRYWVITRGDLVYHSNFSFRSSVLEIPAGATTELLLPIEVPLGTPAGEYLIEILEVSEALTTSGEVIRPTVVPGTIELLDEVGDGYDLPFPPIEFVNVDERRIGGGVEMRFFEESTITRRRDEIELTVQAKLNRPVNHLPIRFEFDAAAIEVAGFDPLLRDLATGRAEVNDFHVSFSTLPVPPFEHDGWMNIQYRIGGAIPQRDPYFSDRCRPHDELCRQPSLRYISPMGEWLDVAKIRLRIREDARGSEFPLLFRMDRWVHAWDEALYSFYGKTVHYASCETRDGPFWRYEPTIFHDSIIIVEGDDEPPPLESPVPPELADIRYRIGSSAGSPGEVVTVPIEVTSGTDLQQLRMVVGFESERIELVGFEFERIDPFGETGTFLLDVEHGADFNVFCEPDEDPDTPCFVGFPFYNVLHNTARHPGETHAAATVPDGTLIVDLLSLHDFAHDPTVLEAIPWEANREYVVGSAVFRIRKDAEPGNVSIAGVTVEWTPGGFVSPIVSECAGYPVLDHRPRRGDIPAVSVEAGWVRIALGDSEFLRGDTDGNDALELTDAVATLTALFITGEELSCEDAADTNDDGELNLSDPVFTLSPLFLGGPNPPEPFPENGSDPTPDALRCDRP